MVAARDGNLDAAIAVTRFGLGARPGEIASAAGDPRGYLKEQIRLQGADIPTAANGRPLKTTSQLWDEDASTREMRRSGVQSERETAHDMRRNAYEDEFMARARLGVETMAGFRERWALFWCNHFATARRGQHSPAVVGSFEREAIRPHVFGSLADLLLASTHHATMLRFLDQSKSVGPHSERAEGGNRGLNENLAREVMELHSLGVDAGYTQNDVTEMARALTGWSTANNRASDFKFRPQMHEPGAREIFGKRYPEGGEGQAASALRDFAASPHTAHHLATKIARHFVADNPPPALVAKLDATYRDSGGRLDRVADALIAAPDAWDPAGHKFKTPYEFLISSWRAAATTPRRFQDVIHPLKEMGHEVFAPSSPKGWDDDGESWAGAASVLARVQWASDFSAEHAPAGDPIKTAKDILGARLTQASATAIGRAQARSEAFAILLMIPEFQRR